MQTNFITLQNVCKSYGVEPRQVILNNLSLDVQKGESIAVLGHSGCGKSTLLNLISGIDLTDSGAIFVDGVNLANLSEHDRTLFRRKHIGFVYQSFNLIQTLTAIENVKLPLQLNDFPRDKTNALAEQILERVGLTGRFDAFPDQLSGGEQQRVAIARAMVHSPSLVLADEHTGNLDAATGREMMALFHQLASARQQTVITVTHSLSVAKSADRIVRFEDGHLQTDNEFDATSLAW